jgi:hypothetical protein
MYRLNHKRLGVAGEWLGWFDTPPATVAATKRRDLK